MKTHTQGQEGMSSRFQEEHAYSWEGWSGKKALMPTEQGISGTKTSWALLGLPQPGLPPCPLVSSVGRSVMSDSLRPRGL